MRPEVALATGLAAAGLVAASADNPPAPKVAVIVIDGTAYAPATAVVRRGQRVTWENRDPFPHTVTAKGAFDSGVMAAGKQWSYVPAKAGRWDYICTLHPNMMGTLVVE